MQLSIAIYQQDIFWEKVSANQLLIEEFISKLSGNIDMVILPEMFLTGFSMNISKIALTMEAKEIKWLINLSTKNHKAIIGSLPIKEGNKIFNRTLLVKPDGTIEVYNKRHLFRMGEENNHYTAGNKRCVFEYKGVRILPQICYDLRFPVWSRNRNDYDMIIYMANWPKSRNKVWNILLKARAIENQCYVIGVNRIGIGGDVEYSGNSCVIDFKGDKIIDCKQEIGAIRNFEFDKEKQDLFKSKFPAYLDSDDFELEI